MRAGHVHASCVVIGEAGVLIRGTSGAGKSTLARRLIDAARRHGLFARLVGDDRIRLVRGPDRVVARPHETVRGWMEVRGLGIAVTPWEGAAVLRLVVDVADKDPPRFPGAEEGTAEVAGLRLPRIACRPEDDDRVLGILGLGPWSPNPKR